MLIETQHCCVAEKDLGVWLADYLARRVSPRNDCKPAKVPVECLPSLYVCYMFEKYFECFSVRVQFTQFPSKHEVHFDKLLVMQPRSKESVYIVQDR